MLTFRNTNIASILLLAGLITFDINHDVSLFLYAGLIFLYSLLLFYGCYFIGSGFFIKAICSIKTNKKEIAISFDDGPATAYTPEILQVLKEHNVKAAFFCIGNRIENNTSLLQQIHAEGHIIGNHSYSHHFWFDLFPTKKVIADLQLMDECVQKTIGVVPKLFRPPYGVTNPNIKKAVAQRGYTTIGWNVRSMDTVIKDEKKLLDKIIAAIKPGAIFLFHDTSKTTLAILPSFIKKLKDDGYEIVRLDKMLHLQPYA